ncbi:unnamed protein product [Cuscuta europaea]|uniref:Uncharacterized protein n=1 Tax=Cuscuta europaea TaxID=41803 RepID=A0A9P0YX59_CUSEU|nr:unnamed protein product [Cuscuta europaea]
MSMLLGPPEVHTTTSSAAAPPESDVADSFMHLMLKKFNSAGKCVIGKPVMGKTANQSHTYLSTGNPCLDFFFHVVPDTPAKNEKASYGMYMDQNHRTIEDMLQRSWSHNPLTTLKLICNLRGVGGTGKSDKEAFYASALWLHSHHPKSLACNLGEIARFGYLKDFLEILYRILEGGDVRKRQKEQLEWQREMKNVKYIRFRGKKKKLNKKQQKKKRMLLTEDQKEAKKLTIQNRMEEEKANAKFKRESKRIEKAKKVIERYKRDADFRYFHDRVSDLFAQFLKRDLETLKQGSSPNLLSQAAMWCPSLDSSFDRSTLLCESIARKLFPKENHHEYQGIEDSQYAYRVRDRLRKEVLVPLRDALKSPEVSKDWGILLPHQIVESLSDDDGGALADSRWNRMVNGLSNNGEKKMKNCLAVCDVSESMEGAPLQACLALGLLVSELSEEPWKGKLITFSDQPRLHTIKGNNLLSKVDFVKNMKLVRTKDFQKVIDMILEVAVNGNLREDQMIKRLFVFSDMEFDETPSFTPQTDYQAIERKFREKGYWNCVPEIVFWNLKDSKSTPVLGNQKGVALVSGHSQRVMKVFLDKEVITHPLAVTEFAISGDEYQNLAVID